MSRYWIGVVSRSHVQRGVEGGFAQVCHGKRAPLERMQAGDWLMYYSPRTDFKDGQPLQAFTAIGQIKPGKVYSFEMSPDFVPFRRDVDFLEASQASIKPLLPHLSFTQSPNWGYALRRGVLEITRADFELIAKAMSADVQEPPLGAYDRPDAQISNPV